MTSRQKSMMSAHKLPLMACGHVAQAIKDDQPVCVICQCKDVNENLPDLSNREARCDCGHITESNFWLPFFEYRPNDAYDTYYCGCYGWS